MVYKAYEWLCLDSSIIVSARMRSLAFVYAFYLIISTSCVNVCA